MRIGFLFNHDQIHQVAHSLPVAKALAAMDAGHEIIVATTLDRLADEVIRQLGPDAPKSISRVRLSLKSRWTRMAAHLFGGLFPATKLLLYRDNLDFFRSLDLLVVTERTSLILKTRYGLNHPKMILTDHGAGDRAIGFGSSTALFDHILAAGPKIRDRMVAEAGVDPARIRITGYPKFDTVSAPRDKPLFAHADRPTVLYNPHVSPHLSSWYKQGRAVLDYFLTHPEYNLIFAPHIMMFQRKVATTIDKLAFGFPGTLDPKYAAAENIHVDLGSLASTDMTYTNGADIYLGDVSSQVYEFLRVARPCVFLNTHRIDHAGDANFAHWQAGPVILSVDDLDGALQAARSTHKEVFLPIQKKLFDHTFDLTSESSSSRAACAIIDIANGLLKAEQINRNLPSSGLKPQR